MPCYLFTDFCTCMLLDEVLMHLHTDLIQLAKGLIRKPVFGLRKMDPHRPCGINRRRLSSSEFSGEIIFFLN